MNRRMKTMLLTGMLAMFCLLNAGAKQRNTETTVPAKPYCVAVRTNMLYDAMLLPTLGVEWRINRDLSPCFSIDFNLGLGYTHVKYDAFRMEDGVRVGKERNKPNKLWGPTQAGISLVWTIGGNK